MPRSTSAVETRKKNSNIGLQSCVLRLRQPRSEELAAGAGLAPAYAPSKGAVLQIRRPGNKLVARQGNAPCSTD